MIKNDTVFGKHKEKAPICADLDVLFALPIPSAHGVHHTHPQEPQLLQEICSGESQKSLGLALRLQR